MVLTEIGLSGLIDIAIMAFIFYLVMVWFKQSRAAVVLLGIIIVAVVYFLAQQFNLVLTAGIFQLFFAVILFAVVVIFQEEIRRFFEQIAMWSFARRLQRRKIIRPLREEVDILARTLIDLAREKTGALIILRGKNLISDHLEGGIDLNGQLSEHLLKSIFDPHSIGHDGAVVIESNLVTQFGAHLPLSKNLRKLSHGGTRHAAALGITELTDAMSLVVSEERGVISYCRHGDIRTVKDAEALGEIIGRFYREISPKKEAAKWFTIFTKNYKEKLIAIGLAVLLWFVQVYGSKVIYKTYIIPVEHAELKPDLVISDIEPKNVEVTFSGPWRKLYFLSKDKVRVFIKTLNLKPGTSKQRISASNLEFPKNIKLEDIDPKSVVVETQRKTVESEDKGED